MVPRHAHGPFVMWCLVNVRPLARRAKHAVQWSGRPRVHPAHLAPGCMCPFCATQSSGGHVSITDGVLNPLQDDPKFKGKKRTSPVSPIAFANYK